MSAERVASERPIQIFMQDTTRKKISLPTWGYIAIGSIVVYAMYKLYKTYTSYYWLRTVEKRCLGISPSENILILIHSYRDSQNTASSILSAIQSAYCPKRVFFGIYQELEPHDADVYQLCESYVTMHEKSYLQNNVRIISMDDAKTTTNGSLSAWRELSNRTTMGEKYFLIVHPGAEFTSNWDKLLIDEYKLIQGTTIVRPEETIVLSMVPQKEKRVVVESSPNVDTWMKTLQQSGNSVNKAIRAHRLGSSFPVVKKFNGRIPVITSKIFPNTPASPAESTVMSTSLCFGKLENFVHVCNSSPLFDYPIADYATDWIMSAALYSDGMARFFVPRNKEGIVVERRTHTPKSCRPKYWSSKDLSAFCQKEYYDFMNYVGVDKNEGIITGRAQMGLLPGPQISDIIKKYGTLQEYERIRRAFK